MRLLLAALLLLVMPTVAFAAPPTDAGVAKVPEEVYAPLGEGLRSPLPSVTATSPNSAFNFPNPALQLQSMLSGDWTPEREVFPANHLVGYAFAVAVDAQERPVLTFVREDQSQGYARVLYWTRYDGGSWSPVARVSPSDNSRPFKPRLTGGQDGRAWLVWNNGTTGGIWYAVLDSSQWSVPARVNPPDGFDQYSPVIAHGGGALWCAWYGTSDSGNDYDVFVSEWTGTQWTEPRNLTSGIPGWHWFVDLKVDSEGQPHLVWGDSDAYQIYFSMKPTSGDWTQPERISQARVDGWEECRLALDDADRDHVVWLTATSDLGYTSRSQSGWVLETVFPKMAWGVNYPTVGCGGGRTFLAWAESTVETDHIYGLEPGGGVDQLDQGRWYSQNTPEIIFSADSSWTFWVGHDELYTVATFLYSTQAITAPVPVQITFASVHREQAGVVLEWRTSESNQGTFYVDRELPSLARERISDAVPSTSAGYSFRDASDPPIGTNYYLELLDRAGGTTTFGPYELLDAPGVLGVAPMLTATPNPFRSGVKLTARNLPAGDLSIEICSVAGRVLHSEPPISGFGGGNAEIQTPGLDALPAGLYFVRVQVGATSVTTKVVKFE